MCYSCRLPLYSPRRLTNGKGAYARCNQRSRPAGGATGHPAWIPGIAGSAVSHGHACHADAPFVAVSLANQQRACIFQSSDAGCISTGSTLSWHLDAATAEIRADHQLFLVAQALKSSWPRAVRVSTVCMQVLDLHASPDNGLEGITARLALAGLQQHFNSLQATRRILQRMYQLWWNSQCSQGRQ